MAPSARRNSQRGIRRPGAPCCRSKSQAIADAGPRSMTVAIIRFSIEVKILSSKTDLAHYWLEESINKLRSPHLPYAVIREIQITVSCSRELTQTDVASRALLETWAQPR